MRKSLKYFIPKNKLCFTRIKNSCASYLKRKEFFWIDEYPYFPLNKLSKKKMS